MLLSQLYNLHWKPVMKVCSISERSIFQIQHTTAYIILGRIAKYWKTNDVVWKYWQPISKRQLLYLSVRFSGFLIINGWGCRSIGISTTNVLIPKITIAKGSSWMKMMDNFFIAKDWQDFVNDNKRRIIEFKQKLDEKILLRRVRVLIIAVDEER